MITLENEIKVINIAWEISNGIMAKLDVMSKNEMIIRVTLSINYK